MNRFALERLDPTCLATLVSDWLAAPAEVQACLLRVPNLTPEVYVQALTAWTSLPTERPKLPSPIPTHLLTGLRGEALATVLHHDLRHRDDAVLRPPVSPDTLDSLVLAVAIAIPDMAASLRQGYTLRWWHNRLRAMGPSPQADPPADPEARWVLSVTKLYAHEDPIKVRRALIIHHLFEGWSPDRQAAMAKPIAQWMDTLPYIA